jgi:acyl carrier protein
MAAPPTASGLVEFCHLVAGLTDLQPEFVTPEATFVDDLGLDSITLANLLAQLIERHQLRRLDADLLERDWREVTVEELYSQYWGR